jgi:hypothetical protein
MCASLRRAGATVQSITDGEIDERRNWIIPIIDNLRNDPDLELVRSGGWSSYQDLPRYRIRRGHRFSTGYLDLPHVPSSSAVTRSSRRFAPSSVGLGWPSGWAFPATSTWLCSPSVRSERSGTGAARAGR